MDPLILARLQFASTSIYHYFFVPLTLGLSIMVAIMETVYVRTGNETFKKMTKFWGKLFLINFVMGVVTGIVQEFQFGMNWSEYSRFMGDIFGAPLAIEALMAFFLESVFLGLWVFGWDKLPKWGHAGTMWAVAFGSNISALWILIANSFMQEPVGYVLNNGRVEMTDFGALFTNPHVWVQFPHVFTAGITTAAFFMLGISAWHLVKRTSPDLDVFKRSFNWAAVYAVIGVILVGIVGHSQAQHMVEAQPMKMASAEALWDSEDPAGLSLFTIGDERNREDVFAIRIPAMLSLLAYNQFEGEVLGINDIQAQYEETYGPGDYVPPVAISYWAFRIMIGVGLLMVVLALYALYLAMRDKVESAPRFLKWLPYMIVLPYAANTTGWILTEVGRMPWMVFGLQRIEDGISPNVGAGMILTSLILFVLIYGVLMAADVFLLNKYAKAGVETEPTDDSQQDQSALEPAVAD